MHLETESLCNLDALRPLSAASMLKLLKDKVGTNLEIRKIATPIYFPAVPAFLNKDLNAD